MRSETMKYYVKDNIIMLLDIDEGKDMSCYYELIIDKEQKKVKYSFDPNNAEQMTEISLLELINNYELPNISEYNSFIFVTPFYFEKLYEAYQKLYKMQGEL